MKRQWCGEMGGGRVHRQFRWIGPILASLLLGAGAAYGDNVYWIGLGGSDNWSTVGNWYVSSGTHIPGPTDYVYFNAFDSGTTNVVDVDFAIGLLRYLGNGVHTTNVPAGRQLQVAGGPIQVGWEGTNNGAAVTWTGGGTIEAGTSPTDGQAINIGYNGSTKDGETSTSALTITGVTVNTYANSLKDVGISVGANYAGGGGGADATLTLGAGAHLNVGTATFAVKSGITIGYNDGKAGTATGWMDTSGGTANIHVDTLGVGNNKNGDAGALGAAAGTLTLGANNTITADKAYVAWGENTTGVVNMNGGLFAANSVSLGSGATFNFNGGRLAVNEFTTYGGAGTLVQQGGTLAPGFSRTDVSLPGVSILRGNYQLDAAGTLEIELFGIAPGTEYDQLRVLGAVNLGSGALDVKLGFEPLVGDRFTIIDSGLGVFGQFAGLSELGTFDEMYLDWTYRFQISYCSFAASNDVVLKMIEKIGSVLPVDPVVIPAPGAMLLGGIGVGLLSWLRRRRTL